MAHTQEGDVCVVNNPLPARWYYFTIFRCIEINKIKKLL